MRDDDGALRAFYNVCRHRGAELVAARRRRARARAARSIRCPYHSWTYGLDGALRRAPFLADDRPPSRSPCTPSASTRGAASCSCTSSPVAAGAAARPARPGPGPAAPLPAGRAAPRGRRCRYEVAANWKVLAENYNECYHCGPVHPELCELVPSFRRGGGGLEWDTASRTATARGRSRRPARRPGAPFAGLDDAERTRHKGELVYPNLLLSLAAEHVAAFTLRPPGRGRTDDRAATCCSTPTRSPPTTSTRPTPADLWDLVNRQDWAICESVQRGMASRAWTGGWFAPMEDDAADISRWYAPRRWATRS